jgi:hypothetical protein
MKMPHAWLEQAPNAEQRALITAMERVSPTKTNRLLLGALGGIGFGAALIYAALSAKMFTSGHWALGTLNAAAAIFTGRAAVYFGRTMLSEERDAVLSAEALVREIRGDKALRSSLGRLGVELQ